MVHAEDPEMSEESEYGREVDWTSFSKRLEGFVPDSVMKKAAGAIKGVMQTEEGVRTVLSEISREVIEHARDQIDKGKGELVGRVAKEFREFLEKTDIAGEMKSVLTDMQLEVTTQIRFVEREDGQLEAKTSNTKAKRKKTTRPKPRAKSTQS